MLVSGMISVMFPLVCGAVMKNLIRICLHGVIHRTCCWRQANIFPISI